MIKNNTLEQKSNVLDKDFVQQFFKSDKLLAI